MRVYALCILACLGSALLLYFAWRMRHSKKAVKARKKKMYKALENRAKTGDKEAMYQLAKQAYKESDPYFYPLIFKWVSLLAAQTWDPAVWMLLGDLLSSGYGTEPDLKRALSSYERALSADIAFERDTNLPREAHNYLEQQVVKIRQQLSEQK